MGRTLLTLSEQAESITGIQRMAAALGLPSTIGHAVTAALHNSREAYAQLLPRNRLPVRLQPTQQHICMDGGQDGLCPNTSLMNRSGDDCATHWMRSIMEPSLFAAFDNPRNAGVGSRDSTGSVATKDRCSVITRDVVVFRDLEQCCRDNRWWLNGTCVDLSLIHI